MFFQKKGAFQGLDQGPDAPEKTGPARFWELIQGELATVLIANLLFIATCIPVITIPLALLSLHTIMRKIVLSKSVSCVRDYFTAFKQGWKCAYGAFFLTAVPMCIAGYGVTFYLRCMSEHPMFIAPFALCTTFFLVTMLASTYLYGFLSNGKSLRNAIKPALTLGVAKPLRAVLAAICYYGMPLLTILFFPLSGLYLFLLGFSVPCLLGNFYIRTVLKQYYRD